MDAASSFLPNFNVPEPQTQAPAITDVKPPDAAPLAQPLLPTQGESFSPELLRELKQYIEQTVVATVSQAVTTVVPDVVEATMTRVNQPPTAPQATIPVRQQQQAIASHASVGIAQPDDYADYLPGQGIGRRPSESKRDLIAWLATGGIVAVMAGLAAYTINLAPQAQTQQQNQQLANQLTTQSQQILDSNQQILESKQRCGNFSLICNIKE